MNRAIYKIGHILAVGIMMFGTTSCEDWFDVAPESEMTFDDFWKEKNDVLSAVGACYRAMNEEWFLKKMIAWGEVRSDNVIFGKGDETDLTYILTANINAANGYAKWGEFYTVINYCNTVIKYAPGVRNNDPDFSEAELNRYLAEAKAIRAFCYFTLVRTFNEVPYIVEPYDDDSKPYQVAQSTAEDILNALITDLKSVENVAPVVYTNTEYNKGRITQKAIWALIADMYLWLDDYQNCITYCNKVLNTTTNPLSLVRSSAYFTSVFFNGNSDESIWELQFDANTQNNAVRDLYGGASNSDPKLSSYDFSVSTSGLFNAKDLRLTNALVSSNGYYLIKKYIANRTNTNASTVKESDFVYGTGDNNWIIYRLPDIYLMKAEALAELGGTDNLTQAVALVSKTYDRANPDLEPNSLEGKYTTQEQVRNLVFDEKQREFLFEGKRYFDMVRRMRRQGSPTEIINTYLINKYIAMNLDQTTVMSKLNDVDAIYMPIHQDELRLNRLLKQNRFYMVSSDITK